MITGPAHLKIVLMPSRTRLPSLPNSGPRWSITGMSIARRMRSGTGVGPGICRKWRPAVRDEFFDMDGSLSDAQERSGLLTYKHRAGESCGARLWRSRPDARVRSSVVANPLKDKKKDWEIRN